MSKQKILKKCELCNRIENCFMREPTYKEFQTNEMIECPCVNCLVKAMCDQLGCIHKRKYDLDRHKNESKEIIHYLKSMAEEEGDKWLDQI